METPINVPKLRFSCFEGKWEQKTLGEISNSIMYGMNSCAIPFDGVNKYLRITDIDETTRKYLPNPLTSPEGNIEEKYKLRYGDIVFARTGASVGKSYLYKVTDGNLLFAGFLIKFSITSENPEFVYFQTLKNSYSKWVQLMSMRSGQPGINAEEYRKLPIYLSSKLEQAKITNFLTAVDDKQTQLKKKKDLLVQYKKGVIQQLFSQELRFKDENGKDFADWEEKRLSEICTVITKGTTPTSIGFNFTVNGVRFIKIESLTESGEIIPNKVAFISQECHQVLKRSQLKENDILFSIAGALGRIGVVKKEILPANTNQALAIIRISDESCISVKYIAKYFISDFIAKEIEGLKGGAAQMNLSLGQLNDLSIPIPQI